MTADRLPLRPTLVVAAAVLLMIGLGVWQLQRRHEKEALLARYADNLAKPPLPFAALWPVTDAALFRRTSGDCLEVTGWRAEAGRTAAGAPGWRHIAFCRTGVEGPGIAVDVGTSQAAAAPSGWRGGIVRGRMTWLPDDAPLIVRLFGRSPPPSPLIVGEAAAPGLSPSAQPDPASIPNNHLAYAVQWFLFAAVASVIYVLALARRDRRPG